MLRRIDRLPVEIIWRILLISKSSSLAYVCRVLWHACALAPRHVKAEYLFCCWLDSYSLRFTQGFRMNPLAPQLRSMFAPTTYPTSGSTSALRRAATCDILSFVARFGICTPDVMRMLERLVIRSKWCGNICQLYGIFATMPEGTHALVPTRLACHAVPERLFRHSVVVSMPSYLDGTPALEHGLLRSFVRHVCDLTPVGMPESEVRLPPLSDLELIARMILLHRASPNSSQGYPLAMAVHLDSTPLVCLLLATGADPSLKKSIALHVACKKGSLAVVRLLVEQDDALEFQWRTRLRAIVDDLHALDVVRATRQEPPRARRSLPEKGAVPSKRRRLADRCQVDVPMLTTAVRAGAWDAVSYLMQTKGVVPDVSTLRMMDQKSS